MTSGIFGARLGPLMVLAPVPSAQVEQLTLPEMAQPWDPKARTFAHDFTSLLFPNTVTNWDFSP